MNRKLMFLFVFAVGVAVLSCKKDDPKIDLPGPTTASQTYSYGFTSPAGATTTLERTMKLSDFTALGMYQKYVYEGNVNTNSYIDFVKGAAENVELENVTLEVKGNSSIKYNLGTITGTEKYNSLEDLNFLQKVITEMVKKKDIVLQLSYTSTNAIATEVKLNVKPDVTFKFRQ